MPSIYSGYGLSQGPLRGIRPAPAPKLPSAFKGRQANAKRDAALIRMWAAGTSAPEIAQAIGFRSGHSVYTAVRRLGLRRRKNPNLDPAARAAADRLIRALWSDPTVSTVEIARRC